MSRLCASAGVSPNRVPATPGPVAAPPKPAPTAATAKATGRKAAAKPKPPAFEPARLELVLHNLRKRDKGLPKTLRTLRSTVASLLVKPAARDGEADALLDEMRRRGLIAVDGSRVAYSLG